MNPGITMKDVVAHPDRNWNWTGLSLNPSITMKDILFHMDKPWDWYILSMNRFMHSPDVQRNTIKKTRIIRIKHRIKMQMKILHAQSPLYTDLIKLIIQL